VHPACRAAGQLNSVTLSVPLVLSLLSAEICEPAGTCKISTQLSGSSVLVDVAAICAAKASCRNPAPD